MTELERVFDGEVVEDAPTWEDHIGAFSAAASNVLREQLKQARIIASVARIWKEASVTNFAQEVGIDKTTAYNFLRVWHQIEDGILSVRLESPLTMSHYIEASYAEEPQAMLDRAEDEGLSSRGIKAVRKELEVPENVEEVQTIPCPRCGGTGSVIAHEESV